MKRILLLLVAGTMLFSITGCAETQREADKVSYNLSLEADNFNVVRKLTVINCISNDVLFQMVGKISIQPDPAERQLEILVEDENGLYQKHFVGLSDNVAYTVEQMNYKNVEKYKYVINFNPKMWLPVTVEAVD